MNSGPNHAPSSSGNKIGRFVKTAAKTAAGGFMLTTLINVGVQAVQGEPGVTIQGNQDVCTNETKGPIVDKGQVNAIFRAVKAASGAEPEGSARREFFLNKAHPVTALIDGMPGTDTIVSWKVAGHGLGEFKRVLGSNAMTCVEVSNTPGQEDIIHLKPKGVKAAYWASGNDEAARILTEGNIGLDALAQANIAVDAMRNQTTSTTDTVVATTLPVVNP
jgi:hypothetical protein